MTGARALVTGGAGFIGSHVCEALAGAGYAVTALDDLSTGRREHVPAGTTLEVLDVRSAEAAALVRTGGFDVVCHLAAQMDVRKSVADPVADADRNIIGTLNLLEAVRAASRRPRFVFSSTGGAVYGDFVDPPSDEAQAKDPEAPYGIAKLAVEYYLSYYGRVHGIEVATLRYANVYGPRQNPHGEAGVVAIFCQRLLANQALTVFGDGRQTRDYVFVGDVARANVLAARTALPPAGRVDDRAFNIGTGVPTSVLDLASALQSVAGAAARVQHAPARAGEQQRSFVRIEKAARLLDWRPSVTLADGLRMTYEWFRRTHAA
ncbi:MAG TPA: NAD-dependent epimerase/dehydratase family protein [Gemmatimonadaceae bacterium]|nr:NAD-dependent epimerase/dehydratase family protein [Gemmatimonadaceae bacterium]